MKKELIKELRDSFGLKKNHAAILNELGNGDLDARRLVKKTGISIGRIYNLLNELINMGLVEKVSKTPAKYSTVNIQDRVSEFLRHEFISQIEKQQKILSLLEEKETVEIISNSREFDYHTMAFQSRAKWIKIIHADLSLAWFIHPKDEKEFWKIRQLIDKRRKAQTTLNKELSLMKYKSSLEVYENKPVEHIMTKDALEGFARMIKEEFGAKKLKQWANELADNLKVYKNVRIFIIDTPHSIFNIDISDKEVIIVLLHQNNLSGVKLTGKRISDIYKGSFEELKSKARPIEEYLGKII
ncbi:hypothetical protein JXA85_02155 [Candidatus Woesearchaeota archaeon]|nr:hypothetical protein [Candidatus Woesearchaeota archaeon]